MHYFVTGHTGFKGSWLVFLLRELGHEVSGLSLEPVDGALFIEANVGSLLKFDLRGDVRDRKVLNDALQLTQPDVVMHLAAQPLVRESYANPTYTFETNVMGTMNVLASVVDPVMAQLIVTTDKVYRNVDQLEGYHEDDSLGGDDPYSASKAMAEILTQSWVRSFPGVPTATARAGNVIGGGDVSADRLLPDIIRAFNLGVPVKLRYPEAVRPWQHVLDALNGYLKIVDALVAGKGSGAWNFGPDADSFVSVSTVAALAADVWGDGATVTNAPHFGQPHEANLLVLDSTKARVELGWTNKLSFKESVEWTLDWHRGVGSGMDPNVVTKGQIERFLGLNSQGPT